ncbi:MAG: PIN domain-containing protein [Spirochaetota bacterium]|nr:PIN domain-containing protein [Spirochaetota bacterium]
MKIGYIDTSFLLSIIYEDEKYETSVDIWNIIDLKFSSIIIEIESRINLYKYYVNKQKNKRLYSLKEKELNDLLSNITKKMVDGEINLEIKNNDNLRRLRSLDSIHLATANIINKLIDEKLLLCSYDTEMVKVGKDIGFESIDKWLTR